MELALIAWCSFVAVAQVSLGVLVGRRHGANELQDRAALVIQTECPRCKRLIVLPRGRVDVGGGKPAA